MKMKDVETKQNRNHFFSAVVITILLMLSIFSIVSVYNLNMQVSSLKSEIADLQLVVDTSTNQDSSITTISNIESFSLSQL
jgi:glycerol uptake facilitator-like aquaporin